MESRQRFTLPNLVTKYQLTRTVAMPTKIEEESKYMFKATIPHRNSLTIVASRDVEASLYFLARDKLFEIEKPYSLRFPPDGDLPQSNIKREKFRVVMNDMRKGEPPTLEQNGFQIMDMESAMRYPDFDDEERIKSLYLPEVESALLKELGARHVHVMDFAVCP
jgi:hypothetical protein